MYETADIRKGLRIELDSEPYAIIEFQFVKPGKGNAFTRTRIRNLINGSVLDRTFKTGEKLKPADTQDRTMQFLYRDEGDEGFHFMDNSSYVTSKSLWMRISWGMPQTTWLTTWK